MTFEWLEFKIDLESFNQFLKDNIPSADGIVAREINFTIVEAEPFTQDEINQINQYYNSLTEEGELEKINFKLDIPTAINNCKLALLTKTYSSMTIIERKILLNLTLTDSELVSIVNQYR